MILDQIRPELMSDVLADMTNGKGGTSTTLFAKTQTSLQTPVAGSEVTLTDKTSTNTSLSVNHLLDTSTGNGSTYTEWEVNDGSGVSYNRTVKASLVKTSSVESNIIHTFNHVVVQ